MTTLNRHYVVTPADWEDDSILGVFSTPEEVSAHLGDFLTDLISSGIANAREVEVWEGPNQIEDAPELRTVYRANYGYWSQLRPGPPPHRRQVYIEEILTLTDPVPARVGTDYRDLLVVVGTDRDEVLRVLDETIAAQGEEGAK